jgi:hypothetical protein
MARSVLYFFRQYFEAILWATGLLLLAFMDPGSGSESSLCLFHQLGLSFCPGCGLGHSISWFFHGNISASLQAHPFGIVAVIILLHRIYTIIITKKQLKSKAHGNLQH